MATEWDEFRKTLDLTPEDESMIELERSLIGAQQKEIEEAAKDVYKRKTLEELFADYDEGFFQTEEIDWGKPQGKEIW